MTDLIEVAAKLLNIILDAIKSRGDDHATIVQKFEAAQLEAQDAIDKLKASFAADDAAADQAIADAMKARGQ
jgi:translation initiation factor 1 (eIF-1/SUI1)